MSSFKGFFKFLFQKREPIIIRVEIHDDGFTTYREDNFVEYFRWNEKNFICTYKVDCYTYDMIWLGFVLQDEREIQIREETKGFADFSSKVSETFLSIDKQWYFKVQLPPFAENFTILFEREKIIA